MTETIDTAQPEALRLADWLDANSSGVYRPAAAAASELRRLHAESTKWQDQHGRDSRELRKLCEARDTARRERDAAKAALAAAEARNATLTDDAARWQYAMDWNTTQFAVCFLDGMGWTPINNDGPIDQAMVTARAAASISTKAPSMQLTQAGHECMRDAILDSAEIVSAGKLAATKESTDHGIQ